MFSMTCFRFPSNRKPHLPNWVSVAIFLFASAQSSSITLPPNVQPSHLILRTRRMELANFEVLNFVIHFQISIVISMGTGADYTPNEILEKDTISNFILFSSSPTRPLTYSAVIMFLNSFKVI
jgi:hypothetical protein